MPENIKLKIEVQSVQEEMDYLWFLLEKIDFYRKHGYIIEFPSHPEFQKLITLAPELSGVDRLQIEKLFANELYDPEFYSIGLNKNLAAKAKIESIFSALIELKNKWGFRIYPTYNVKITRFGPGGSYFEETGTLLIRTSLDGSFKKGTDPAEIIIHEIIHLGIEDCIVQRYKLDQREKERLVDLIIKLKFGNILEDYQFQKLGNEDINSYIDATSIDELPVAIERYIKDFPRK